jgi:hypothetical protein
LSTLPVQVTVLSVSAQSALACSLAISGAISKPNAST